MLRKGSAKVFPLDSIPLADVLIGWGELGLVIVDVLFDVSESSMPISSCVSVLRLGLTIVLASKNVCLGAVVELVRSQNSWETLPRSPRRPSLSPELCFPSVLSLSISSLPKVVAECLPCFSSMLA